MQQFLFKLTKKCGKVDKYQLSDAQGTVIEKQPEVGPIYLEKSIGKGASYVRLSVEPLAQ